MTIPNANRKLDLPNWAKEVPAVVKRCEADSDYRLRVLSASVHAERHRREPLIRSAVAWLERTKGRAA